MAIRLKSGFLKPIHYAKVLQRYKTEDKGKQNEVQKNVEEYNYLHKSKIPTLRFQHALPRLSIPNLKETGSRYLRALQPIMCFSEYECTEKLVNCFVNPGGKGEMLQCFLQEHDDNHPYSNYYCQFWLDMYLSARDPLPINLNPAILIEKDSSPGLNCQDVRACNLLISSLRFMKSFQDQQLKPHVLHSDPHMVDSFMFTTVTGLFSAEKSVKGATLFKAFPVDMSQYRNLFNFSRIPKLCIDRLYQDERAKHILVLRKGHLYVFDVLDNNGNIIPRGEIFNCIRHILSLERDPCVPGLGALTTLDRNTWAVLRKRIRETSPANAESLQAIDSAIMALCLDDCCESDIGSLLYSILCGNGVNRWFDKSFNLVVNESGEAGINYEPSWGDGIALIRYINEIYRDSTKNPLVFPETEACGDAVAKVKRLEFCFAADIFDTIREVKCQYEHHIKGVEVSTLSYKELGKKYCQSNNLNTDAMVQLAIQLAYYKLKDVFVTAYEPCSTGLFKHGRTEAIRPTTMETKEFCKKVTAACPPSKSELRNMLNKCSSAHEKLMKEAAMGQGFDQHLFALCAIAEKKLSPSDVPEIFLDPGYEIINHNILSACHLASPSIQAGTFGPRGKDGLGIGYRLLNDSVNIFVTNYGEYYCGSELIECINSALNDIYCIIHET